MSASAPLGLVLPGDLDGPIRPRLEFAFRVACGWLGRKAILLQEDTEPDFPFVRYGTDIPALYRPLCEPLRSIPIHGADSAGRADNLGEIFSWISSEIEHYQPDDRWGRKLYSGSLQHRTGLGPHEVPALDSAASLFPQVPMPNVRLIAPTHDVDFLPTSRCDVLVRGMKNSAIHLRAKDPIGAAAVFIKTLLTLAGQQHFRPLSHWVETEARYGFRGSYYFITENSHDKDGNYTTAQAVQSAGVLSDLGAEVGIHGSWSSLDTETGLQACLLYTSPSPRDRTRSRMPSSA